MIAPQPQQQQTTAARAGPSAASCRPTAKGSGKWLGKGPSPSQAPTSRAPSGKGSGYQIVLPEAPMRHATTQPVSHAPQLPVTQNENIPQQHAQAPFAAPPSNSFGIFHSGVGSPGLLGGIITPPPVHAFPPLLNEPPLWKGLPPGLSDVPTSGLLPQGPSMNNVVHAFGVPESHALPANTQQAASQIRLITGEARQDHTPLPGGSRPERHGQMCHNSMPAKTVLDIPVNMPVMRKGRRSCPHSMPAKTVLDIPVNMLVLRKVRRSSRYYPHKTMLTCLRSPMRNFNQLAVHQHTCKAACSMSKRL